ncbi:DUF1269 domain-containing protein [Amycolatopsis sp. NPDC059657]|uniref:DUF1269 domain-containing protein n=1 Tax=Amycolatopsis sp. NPDC059657 TaxID=3346899 RepID=UPI00366D064C
MVTLTIWRFDSAEGANRGARTLEVLTQTELISVHDAAVVSWPEGRKKPVLHQLRHLTSRAALSGAFWGMLFGLIFLVPLLGAAVGAAAGAAGMALTDVGIDDKLIKQVRDQLRPGTSALFVLSSGAVIDKVRNAFTGQDKPELIFTNLSAEEERKLREVFSDS